MIPAKLAEIAGNSPFVQTCKDLLPYVGRDVEERINEFFSWQTLGAVLLGGEAMQLLVALRHLDLAGLTYWGGLFVVTTFGFAYRVNWHDIREAAKDATERAADATESE